MLLCRSPRLDEVGNSVRGVASFQELVKRFSFHNFEVLSGLNLKKIDPTLQKNEAKHAALGEVLFAASLGDLAALVSLSHAGINLYEGDYDSRTALHLAAAGSHPKVVRYLIDHADSPGALSPKDRWGGTPLDDAHDSGCGKCIQFLRDAGAKEGTHNPTAAPESAPAILRKTSVVALDKFDQASADAPTILFPASEGDVKELIKLSARGEDLFVFDYDLRTAQHLAASEGRLEVLKYLAGQAQRHNRISEVLRATDRWGHTALDDARREKHAECEKYLRSLEE